MLKHIVSFFFKPANTLSRKKLPGSAHYSIQHYSIATCSPSVFPIYIANAWLPCTNIGKCHNTGVNQCKCTRAYGKWLSQQHVFIDIFNSKVSIKNLASSIFCTNIVLCAHTKIMFSSVPRSPNHFFST